MKLYSFLLEGGYHEYNQEDMEDHGAIIAVIKKGNKYLILDHNKYNMLTFPMGKVKPGETPLQALKVEMCEELSIKVTGAKELFNYKMIYDHAGKKVRVTNYVFEVENYTGTVKNNEPQKHKWVKFMTLDEVKKSGREIGDGVIEYVKRINGKVYKITGAILGCLGKNANKVNYKITEKLPDDPWIAIIESDGNITLEEVNKWHKYHVCDPDKKGVPYYFVVENTQLHKQYVLFSDDNKWYPINTKQEKQDTVKIGLKKGLVKDQLDF